MSDEVSSRNQDYPLIVGAPSGVFFLFGQGRMALCRGRPAEAIKYYTKAVEAQNQYRNMYHISHWEIAVANLALWDVSASLTYWRMLSDDATVSRLC